jgi:hypothetical protein
MNKIPISGRCGRVDADLEAKGLSDIHLLVPGPLFQPGQYWQALLCPSASFFPGSRSQEAGVSSLRKSS